MRLQAPAHRIAVVLVERALGLEVTVDDVVSLGSLAFTSRRGRLTPDDRAETMALLRKHSRRTGPIVLLAIRDLDLALQLANVARLLDNTRRLAVDRPDALIERDDVDRSFDTSRSGLFRVKARTGPGPLNGAPGLDRFSV